MDNPSLFAIALKDEQYHKYWVEDVVQEITQRCLGVKKWMQFRSAITVLSRFGYFATNRLSEIPTPGEEFCRAKVRTYSLIHRLLTILFNNNLRLPREIPKPFGDLIKDVHIISFYFFGDFYELSKRATGEDYVMSDQDQLTETSAGSYNVVNNLIGCMLMVKLILGLPDTHKHIMLEQGILQKPEEETTPSLSNDGLVSCNWNMLCHLCSAHRKDATSTLCGHIFCWKCINEWLRQKNECPTCRTPTEPSRLIHLINFK